MDAEKTKDATPGFDDPRATMIGMFPGLLFGFPPQNLHEMMDRLECPDCREILEMSVLLDEVAQARAEHVREFQRPAIERNIAKQERFARRSRLPIIGRFFRPPKLEDLPEHRNCAWYCWESCQMDIMTRMIDSYRERDPKHWKDAQESRSGSNSRPITSP